jgi:hypothetical protein
VPILLQNQFATSNLADNGKNEFVVNALSAGEALEFLPGALFPLGWKDVCRDAGAMDIGERSSEVEREP